ncbi:MAG TPA: hypothetical protein VHG08_26900 [Longimicrobium sp.]|nr:hypothetical protein [Longimicrobium sp.]
MALRMDLWRVDGKNLTPVPGATVDIEQRLENWIAADPRLTGLDILIIGRQVVTPNRGRIDLLAIDADANSVVLELKRDKTPREIVAQVLDYASWVQKLSFVELDAITQGYCHTSLADAYRDRFGSPLPETVNEEHSLVIVAAELDESSERIVQYLGDRGIAINVVFFNMFRSGEQELVGRAWLRDPIELEEQTDSRRKAPWSGYWFVNVGESEHRNWDDNVKYGYIGAGGGEWYSHALRKLQIGDWIFAYMKGLGYVGYGEVLEEARPAKEVRLEDGIPLLEHDMRAPNAGEFGDDPTKAEWAVRVRWLRTFPRDQARTFSGAFANQNIVCKLRHPETVQFVEREFGVDRQVSG